MKRNFKWLYFIIALVLMALVENYFTYWLKSVFKLFLFLIIPYFSFNLNFNYKKIKISKNARYLSILTVLSILFLYMALSNFLDFNAIRIQIESGAIRSAGPFFWIGLYISFVNAWIEEFFFRGLYYLEEGAKRNTILSAGAFAVYHLAIMHSWISFPLLILSILGLFFVGIVFNYLSLESESIFSSYCVHLFANLTINALAFFFLL